MAEIIISVISHVCSIMIGGIFTLVWLIRHGMLRHPQPYRYVCMVEGCVFEVSSNSIEITHEIATVHERSHL